MTSNKQVLKIALYKKDESILDKIIKKWTKSRYSHVELLLPNGIMISSVPNIGIRSTTKWNTNDYDFWDIEITDNQLKILINILEEELGCDYDWVGIFLSQVVNLNRQSKEKWFCSEFVAHALTKMGVMPNVGLLPSRFSPEDVYKFAITRNKQWQNG